MDNKMKQYLGEAYTENHLRNFCLYWMKGRGSRDNYPSWDDWRRENDYFLKLLAQERDSLGKYFLDESGEVDPEKVEQWVKREHLDIGYEEGCIDQNHVLSLTKTLPPGEAKMFTTEEEIREALQYMIHFLEERKQALELERITCQEIRDLYHLLKGLEQPYLLCGRGSDKDQEKVLYYLEDLSVHKGENHYYYDPCGIEIPAYSEEWVAVRLVRMEEGTEVHRNMEIGVNVIYANEHSAEELLTNRGIAIPDAKELQGVEKKDGIPIYHSSFCAAPPKNWLSRGDRYRSTAVRGFEDYLKSQKVVFTREENKATPFILFKVPASNAPDEEIEGVVFFYEYVAEMKLYYVGTKALCEKSNYHDELLRVLNFVNARIFPACNEAPQDQRDMQLYFVPRISLEEDDDNDIVAGTMFHYEIWNQFLWEVGDYATKHCVEFLDTLAEPIIKVLTGEMKAEEAINDIVDRIE
ncbi:MAG: hypothetical protein ACI4FY_06515 [Acetatifactor sp.]